MLLSLRNTPRDYAWGSTRLIAELEGREPSGAAEAEVWFGDHAGSPAVLADGTTLDAYTAEHGIRLPYLLKILAAAAPLSIQAHPSKAQAEAGFAQELALAADDPSRNYKDDNHKPEIIVALSETFEALAGLRAAPASARLFAALGAAGEPVISRLESGPLDDLVAWVLSDAARDAVAAILSALDEARSDEFAAELETARWIALTNPGDAGVVVALLMNLVVLRRGEGVFLRAGMLHAYLRGLGVELMASSDNVLRGGLTPKRIDVPELLHVLADPGGDAEVLRGDAIAPGVVGYGPGVADFELQAVTVAAGAPVAVAPRGPAILLATEGTLEVREGSFTESLRPGVAVLIVPGVDSVSITGSGRGFLAQPGE